MRIRKFQEPVGKSHYRVRARTNVQTGRKQVRVVIPASPVSSPLSPSLMQDHFHKPAHERCARPARPSASTRSDSERPTPRHQTRSHSGSKSSRSRSQGHCHKPAHDRYARPSASTRSDPQRPTPRRRTRSRSKSSRPRSGEECHKPAHDPYARPSASHPL